MQQMADWLKKLGMSEYTERFAEDDIDFSVLRQLTDQDLKELGLSLGHRRKLLAAIAELSGGAATPAQLPSELNKQEAAARREPTPTTAATAPPAKAAGERSGRRDLR